MTKRTLLLCICSLSFAFSATPFAFSQSGVAAAGAAANQIQSSSQCGPAGCIAANDSSADAQDNLPPDDDTLSDPNQAMQDGGANGRTLGQPTDDTIQSANDGSSQVGDGRSRGIDGNFSDRTGTRSQRGYNTQNTFPRTDENGRPYPYDDRSGFSRKTPQTAFEKFVQDATGHFLPTFGREFFLNKPADFLPATSVSPPADYIVGSGDQLRIRAWGGVNIDVSTTVDRNGQIYIPHVGVVPVAGTRVDQLQGLVRSVVAKEFKTFDLAVTLGQLRSIQVFVLGDARRPGVYTISSLSTLVNALFASGGPSDTGSLRDIQLKREGKIITHFDVYDLLLEGDKTKDVHLLPGDILFIPTVGPQAAVDGDITKPAIYELRANTTAEDLLHLAGGLTPLAGVNRVSLNRITDHQRRIVQDFPLNGAQNLIQMQGGDLLRIFPISPKISKSVTLRGNIGTPGRYQWREGMRISDLIPNREFLLPRRYFNQQNALNPPPATHPFGVQKDTTEESGPNRTASSNTSSDHPMSGSTTAISGDVAAAAGSAAGLLNSTSQMELVNHDTEINWNYAVIERLAPHDLKTTILPFSLGEAVDDPSSPENKMLEPGDVVVVYSRNDINLPQELRAQFVRIDGEVNKPGVYRLEPNETLRELVQQAGGIAPHGYLYAAQLLRESVRISEELKLREMVAQASRDVLSPANESISADGRVNTGDLDLRRAYVAALSKVHATGRVTLQLSPTAEGADVIPEFALQDGDHFFVPPQPNTVDVLGNVFNPGSLRYIKDAKVGNYLKTAGDRTRTGDKNQEFVLRADGTVLSRQTYGRFDKLVIYPGDTVVVPARLRPGFSTYQLINLSQIFSSFALAALSIRALQ